MNTPVNTIAFSLALTMMLSACSQPPSQASKQNTTNKTEPKLLDVQGIKPTDIKTVSKANNQFAIDFFKLQISKNKDNNLFFSPYSLSTALAMTYEGATGKTAKEMAKVLHFPEKEILRLGSAGIYNQLNQPNSSYQLHTVNALWVQTGLNLKKTFTQNMDNFYGGYASELAFYEQPEKAAKTINNFIASYTNQKINNLVTAKLVKPAQLVLTNALYFSSAWEDTFDSSHTKIKPFYLTAKKEKNKTVATPMMTKYEAYVPYFANKNIKMVSLAYKADNQSSIANASNLSMLVILPKANTDINSQLTAKNIALWQSKLKDEVVNLHFPKFKLENSYQFMEDLSQMGMPSAFSDEATFTQMSDKRLKISKVIHKAFIEVTEEGTEAAAATAVAMDAAASADDTEKPKAKVFNANHPFVFAIIHKQTGNILFMGRVQDPR